MRIPRVKPFTLFLCMLSILFLIISPQWIWIRLKKNNPLKPLYPVVPEWTGIITIWDIPYVECGTGSYYSWLNTQIRIFEKQHPGVFIEVRAMTPQRAKMYFQGNNQQAFMPDIISLSSYESIVPEDMLADVSSCFSDSEMNQLHPLARKRVVKDGKILGVPWMMGAYGLFFNQELMDEKDILLTGEEELSYSTLTDMVQTLTFEKKSRRTLLEYYGFCSYYEPYSRPLLSMFYQDGGKIQADEGYEALVKWKEDLKALPDEYLSFERAWELFGIEGRVGIMLGSSRILYRMRSRQESGKGFRMLVRNLPVDKGREVFNDQVAAYGLLKQKNPQKEKVCAEFLKHLIKNDIQKTLNNIGMFPVKTSVGEIYQHDPEMNLLENSLHYYKLSPDDVWWLQHQAQYNEILKELIN